MNGSGPTGSSSSGASMTVANMDAIVRHERVRDHGGIPLIAPSEPLESDRAFRAVGSSVPAILYEGSVRGGRCAVDL
jgi:hypothetical protein